MKLTHSTKTNQQSIIVLAVSLVFALALGMAYIHHTPDSPAALAYSPAPPTIARFDAPLSEGLLIARYSQTESNLEGYGDDTSVGPLTLSIPTQEGISQFTMNVDGKTSTITDYGTYFPDADNMVLFIWSHATPLSLWLEDGDHTISFEVQTTSHTYEGAFSVHIDTGFPTASQKGNVITVTDDRALEGATLTLFDRSGVNAPIIVEEFELSGTEGTVTIESSNKLVSNGEWFRILSISDEAGNSIQMTPDDSRVIEEVISDYAGERMEKVMAEYEQLDLAVDSPTYGPIYVFNYDADTTPVPGNMWDVTEKKTNLAAAINGGRTVLQSAGGSSGYTAPSFPTVSTSSIEIKNEYSFNEFGIRIQAATFNGSIQKEITALDLTDSQATGTFLQKMWSIKSADFSKTPIVMVDNIIRTGTAPAMQYNYNGWVTISYRPLSQVVGGTSTWTFDTTLASMLFAHEMGHALGLGHAKDSSNLMNPFPTGTAWTPVQAAYVSAHMWSDGLKPGFFGIWHAPNATVAEYQCSNRMLEVGKVDSTDQKYFEEAEDTYAGKFTTSNATSVEMDDHQANGSVILKFCPISSVYNSSGGKLVLDPPVAVPTDPTALSQLVDTFANNNQNPVMEVALTRGSANENVGLYACGCYSYCEFFCKLATGPPSENQELAQELCSYSCGGDPNYIQTVEEFKETLPYLGYEEPPMPQEGCACPPMMGQIASSSCGVTAGVCGGTCTFVIEGPPYIYEAACVGY